MNQLRGVLFRVGRSRIRLNLRWVIPGLLLAMATGWFLAHLVVPSPGLIARALTALAATAGLVFAVGLREIALVTLAGRFDPQRRHAVLYPTGTAPSAYHIARTPGTEIRQALIGPVVSLIIGCLALVPWLVVPDENAVIHLLAGFGLLNLALVGITMMPAFPLSGGYILRAAFWHLHDDHFTGSKVAFLYGQVVAAGSLGYGALLLSWRTSLLIPGIWCLYLGWLVVRGSRSELLRSHLIDRAARIRASDAVAGLNPTIRAADTLANAVDILLEQRSNGPGLVRDRNEFVGVLTLVSVRAVSRSEWGETRVRDVMTPFTAYADSEPDARLLEILRIRSDLEDRPVIVRHPGGQIAGLISDEIAPRVLLRRGEERSVDLQHRGPARKGSAGS